MKVIYKRINLGNYAELDQKNPLRWTFMKKVKDTYTNSSNIFKCKDFFNDVIAYRHLKKKFVKYGMGSDSAKFTRKGGIWVLLNNTTDSLIGNIERCINKEFKDTWGIKLEMLPVNNTDFVSDNLTPHKMVLMYIPKKALTNTFRISLITLMIRNCNVWQDIASYDDLITPAFGKDGSLDECRYNMLKKRAYQFPGETEWVFYTPSYNSKSTWANWMTSVVHNNGVMGFTENLVPDDGKKGYTSYWHNATPAPSSVWVDDEEEFDEDEELEF
mgnify:FL=1